MEILGDCNKNKWCCFCKYWYDPANKALKPKNGRGLFMVNKDMMSFCSKKHLQTRAIGFCGYSPFEKKPL